MAISTLDKLYGYLKGYEIACFTGDSKSVVANSISELLQDELSVLFAEAETNVKEDIHHDIFKGIDLFLTRYYERMRRISSPDKVKSLADKSKQDFEELRNLLSFLIQGDEISLPVLGVMYCYCNRQGNVLTDLCQNCPKYIHGSCIIGIQYADDPDNLVGYQFKFQIPEYRYLGRSLIDLTYQLLSRGIDPNHLRDYSMLYNHILTGGQVFQLMNPSGDAREQQIVETKHLLTQTPLNPDDKKYSYYHTVLLSVFTDIREGKLKYIQDFRKAWLKERDFILSKYDYEKDPYYALKGSAQKSFTGMPYSLQSSPFEVDWYHDQFTNFDTLVEFNSPYFKPSDDPNITLDQLKCAKTILINNPGKFKGRIIHIFDNPIQDRANYIHRRLSRLMDNLVPDCTKNQDKGRQFLQKLTLDWFFEDDPSKKIGIYCGDFSNATDTLDQNFQCEILNFIFMEHGEIISEFWRFLSNMPKFLQHVDGSFEQYTQTCGQPQGCLGSFDSFSLAHYFIFLMTMKLSGLEDYSAEEFFSVLGDDSAFNSIIPEIDLYDESNSLYIDSEGIHRSSIEYTHYDICKYFANFDINYSKSSSAHWNSNEARLDFAKVTFRNGEFFSPLPFRLSMRYCKDNYSKMAVAIWRGERQEQHAKAFMDVVLNKINNDQITDIVYSGTIPFLEPFKRTELDYNSSWLARLRYSYAISCLSAFFAFSKMSDSIRDLNSLDSLWYALDHIFYYYDHRHRRLRPIKGFTRNSIDNVSPRHKIWNILSHNEQLISLLKEIYNDQSIDDQTLSILSSPLCGEQKEEFISILIDILDMRQSLESVTEESDVSELFPDANLDVVKELKAFSQGFVSRGTAKGPRDEALILRLVLQELSKLNDILGSIPNIVSA